jgi:hypothetical protein
MLQDYTNLRQRILQTARLATAVHLNHVAESSVSTSRGQRVVIGGAGPQVVAKAVHIGPGAVTDFSTDGRLLAGGGRDGGVEADIPCDAPSRPVKDSSSTKDTLSSSSSNRSVEGAD